MLLGALDQKANNNGKNPAGVTEGISNMKFMESKSIHQYMSATKQDIPVPTYTFPPLRHIKGKARHPVAAGSGGHNN